MTHDQRVTVLVQRGLALADLMHAKLARHLCKAL